jgi:hypothetical protein
MPAPRLTTDEYFRTAETVLPQELIHGIVQEAPAPTPGHQSVVGRFFMALAEYVRSRRFLAANEIIRSNVLPDLARSVASILI